MLYQFAIGNFIEYLLQYICTCCSDSCVRARVHVSARVYIHSVLSTCVNCQMSTTSTMVEVDTGYHAGVLGSDSRHQAGCYVPHMFIVNPILDEGVDELTTNIITSFFFIYYLSITYQPATAKHLQKE